VVPSTGASDRIDIRRHCTDGDARRSNLLPRPDEFPVKSKREFCNTNQGLTTILMSPDGSFASRGEGFSINLDSAFLRSLASRRISREARSNCENDPPGVRPAGFPRRLGASGAGQFIGCKFCRMIEAEGDHLSGYSDTTKCSICPIASLKLTRKFRPEAHRLRGGTLAINMAFAHRSNLATSTNIVHRPVKPTVLLIDLSVTILFLRNRWLAGPRGQSPVVATSNVSGSSARRTCGTQRICPD
jgi:hypothetical protein